MSRLKLIVVAGARPNFMKVAPLLRQMEPDGRAGPSGARSLEAVLVHTGQHYDANMSDVFFRELGIRRPDINLGVGSGTHAAQTAGIMAGFEPVCARERPDWVVVVGDVNSTMACSLVCAKMGIRVAHVEAGLRSYDRTMPEEINRLVTDALADLLLTPSEDAGSNLLREGVDGKKIRLVGNIMIDSLIDNLPQARASRVLDELGLQPRRFIYVTIHRPANVDDPARLRALFAALDRLAERLPVVFPIHPRTRKMLSEGGFSTGADGRLKLLEPLGYHASLRLTEDARAVLTDSGGLQEEATYFRTPCLTLRPNTERPVTVSLGSNRLTTLERCPADVEAVLAGPERIGRIPPLWDGRTAGRIVDEIVAASADREGRTA